MRKNISFVFLALVLCLLALTGCSKMRAFERDVQVVLDVNGEMTGYVTVNIFNNAVIKEPQAPANTVFRGWTLQDSWTQEESSNVPIIQNKGLVRYNDIKDALKNDQRSIVIHAVFAPIPRRDLVIAWYAKEATSGLNQGHIDVLRDKLYEYLRSEGYKPESMDIAFRGYDGGVADTCAAINKDGDVDITVGWSSSSNLTGTGGWTEGVDFKENTGSITIGAKARYSARISDTDLSKKVYAWILSTFGPTEAPAQSSTPAPAAETAPTQDPAVQAPAADESTLVIGWYAKSGTSGLDESIIKVFESGLKAYLENSGNGSVSLVIRPYDGNVADVQSAVLANGDVDLMVGMKAFALEGIEMEVQNDVAMGPKTDRRIHRISDKKIAIQVFEWLKTEEARKLFVSVQ